MAKKPPVETTEEVIVSVPMSGAAMKQRLDDLKKEKELQAKKESK